MYYILITIGYNFLMNNNAIWPPEAEIWIMKWWQVFTLFEDYHWKIVKIR